MNTGELSGTVKGSNGAPLTSDLAELRRRLAQNESIATSTTLFNNGLSSIQISKVTNGGQPNIPESGINLKGTSVTLTKIRNTSSDSHPQQQQPQHMIQPQYYEDDKALNGSAGVSKSKKKKKRAGNGVRPPGDDWNLVGESWFLLVNVLQEFLFAFLVYFCKVKFLYVAWTFFLCFLKLTLIKNTMPKSKLYILMSDNWFFFNADKF